MYWRELTRPCPGDELKRRSIPAFVALCALLAAAALSGVAQPASPPPSVTIFDGDSNHIWNRTYACLFVRQDARGYAFGADTPDPLLWWQTRHLLTGGSHRAALACLDKFLNSHAEHAIQDPLERAVFQHDLWAIFDWAAAEGAADFPEAREKLERRLATVIRRLALSPDEIRGLPDTYAAAVGSHQFPAAYDPAQPHRAFLPPDLFQPDGPWVSLSGFLEEPTAIGHFTGRSRFLVFIRLPGGREATLAYVRMLRHSSVPPIVKRNDSVVPVLNLALPQFPVGTAVALVRQAIVIDTRGNLVPTALTEMAQLRAYHSITIGRGSEMQNYMNGPSSHDQDFFEFRLTRPQLFAGDAVGLAAVLPEDKEFATFATHGFDPFESRGPFSGPGSVLGRCLGCHSDAGIHSVQSRVRWMTSSPDAHPVAEDDGKEDPIAWESAATIALKLQHTDFKLLKKMWAGPAN